VRIERTLEAWPEIAQAVGLAGSRVMSAVVDVWGWHARFRLARGQTIADVMARLPAIESALVPCGVLPGRTRRQTTSRTASSCGCWRLTRMPSDNDVPIETIADLVGHKGTSVTERVYRHQLKPVVTKGAATMTSRAR
jgi:integrase